MENMEIILKTIPEPDSTPFCKGRTHDYPIYEMET